MAVQHALTALRAKFQSLTRVGFVRSVGILAGGTAFAQALTVLILPLITRLYTPSDFSVLAVFAAILSIISVAACLRLEIAIPIPEHDKDAANLLALALGSCTAVSILISLIVWWFPEKIVGLAGQPGLRPYLWLLPLGIWFASAYAAIQFWATRKKRFSAIAKTRMTRAIGGAGTQVGLGWIGLTPFGLLLGQVVSSGSGLISLGHDAFRKDRLALQHINWTNMRYMLQQYDRFPKYSTFEALANNASVQLPVIIIAALAIGPEAGYLMLATRVMGAPMGLIGSAVSQVYLSQAPKELRSGRLASFTAQILGGLAQSGVGPLLFAGIVAPAVFPLVFGETWQRAGELVAWMTPWFVIQFLASPISMTLHVTGNQKIALNLQLFGLALRVGAVGIIGWIIPLRIVEIYAITGFIFYCIYIYIVITLSNITTRELYKAISPSFIIIFSWIAFALFFIAILS